MVRLANLEGSSGSSCWATAGWSAGRWQSDHFTRMLIGQIHQRLSRVFLGLPLTQGTRITKSIFAMHVRRVMRFSHQRSGAAGVNRHIFAHQVQHFQAVGCGVINGGVAVHGGQSYDFGQWLANASSMDTASSTPQSVSMMIFFIFALVCYV